MGSSSSRPDQSAFGLPPVQADQMSVPTSARLPNLGLTCLNGTVVAMAGGRGLGVGPGVGGAGPGAGGAGAGAGLPGGGAGLGAGLAGGAGLGAGAGAGLGAGAGGVPDPEGGVPDIVMCFPC